MQCCHSSTKCNAVLILLSAKLSISDSIPLCHYATQWNAVPLWFNVILSIPTQNPAVPLQLNAMIFHYTNSMQLNAMLSLCDSMLCWHVFFDKSNALTLRLNARLSLFESLQFCQNATKCSYGSMICCHSSTQCNAVTLWPIANDVPLHLNTILTFSDSMQFGH